MFVDSNPGFAALSGDTVRDRDSRECRHLQVAGQSVQGMLAESCSSPDACVRTHVQCAPKMHCACSSSLNAHPRRSGADQGPVGQPGHGRCARQRCYAARSSAVAPRCRIVIASLNRLPDEQLQSRVLHVPAATELAIEHCNGSACRRMQYRNPTSQLDSRAGWRPAVMWSLMAAVRRTAAEVGKEGLVELTLMQARRKSLCLRCVVCPRVSMGAHLRCPVMTNLTSSQISLPCVHHSVTLRKTRHISSSCHEQSSTLQFSERLFAANRSNSVRLGDVADLVVLGILRRRLRQPCSAVASAPAASALRAAAAELWLHTPD